MLVPYMEGGRHAGAGFILAPSSSLGVTVRGDPPPGQSRIPHLRYLPSVPSGIRYRNYLYAQSQIELPKMRRARTALAGGFAGRIGGRCADIGIACDPDGARVADGTAFSRSDRGHRTPAEAGV